MPYKIIDHLLNYKRIQTLSILAPNSKLYLFTNALALRVYDRKVLHELFGRSTEDAVV